MKVDQSYSEESELAKLCVTSDALLSDTKKVSALTTKVPILQQNSIVIKLKKRTMFFSRGSPLSFSIQDVEALFLFLAICRPLHLY